MPYAALPPADRPTLRALADARWAAMLEHKPELEAAVSLQRRLMGTVMDLAEIFEAGRVPRLSLPPKYLTAKLAAGIPALTGEPIQIPVDTIRPALVGLVRALPRTVLLGMIIFSSGAGLGLVTAWDVPAASAAQEPHLAALQFQRQARVPS